MHFVRLAATLFFPAVIAGYPAERSAPNPSAKTAATKAIALIQDVGAHWKQACTSCHNQLLPLLAFERARARRADRRKTRNRDAEPLVSDLPV